MLSVILPFMANLNTTRYLLQSSDSTKQDKINLDDHQGSLNCFAETVKLIVRYRYYYDYLSPNISSGCCQA